VRELARHARLGQETRDAARLRLPAAARAQDLQREIAAQRAVARREDRAHPALGQRLLRDHIVGVAVGRAADRLELGRIRRGRTRFLVRLAQEGADRVQLAQFRRHLGARLDPALEGELLARIHALEELGQRLLGTAWVA